MGAATIGGVAAGGVVCEGAWALADDPAMRKRLAARLAIRIEAPRRPACRAPVGDFGFFIGSSILRPRRVRWVGLGDERSFSFDAGS